jgi:hypothetical protein
MKVWDGRVLLPPEDWRQNCADHTLTGR